MSFSKEGSLKFQKNSNVFKLLMQRTKFSYFRPYLLYTLKIFHFKKIFKSRVH